MEVELRLKDKWSQDALRFGGLKTTDEVSLHAMYHKGLKDAVVFIWQERNRLMEEYKKKEDLDDGRKQE